MGKAQTSKRDRSFRGVAALKEQKTKIEKTKAKPKTELAIKHELNNIVVEQRVADGFINGTAMCLAHGKEISNWLRTDGTLELVTALASDLGIQTAKIKTEKIRNSVFTRVSAAFPDLVVSKRGSPENGGGVWLHPDLAVQLAQWCNPFFAIQVSRWVREWIIASEEQRRRQKIIAACISDIALPWEKRFDDDFMQDLQRVSGRSRAAAYLLLRYFYEQFSSDVYDRLKEVNPRINGRRRYKQHQHLKDIGLIVFNEIQIGFKAAMRVSPDNNPKVFLKNLNKIFGTTLQLELPLFEDLLDEAA
jgi:hypothetical protein